MNTVTIARNSYRRSDYGYTITIWLTGASQARIYGHGLTIQAARESADRKLAAYLSRYGYEVKEQS